jgi:glycerophosphoryl diester phosphodiesterase
MNPVRCLEDADATILWQHRDHVDEALVSAVHAAGMTLYVYTVNAPEEMRRFLGLGVDGIATDFPDLLRPLVDPLPR